MTTPVSTSTRIGSRDCEQRADHVDRGHRGEPAGEGQALDGDHAEREIDADDGAERRPRRRAENIGRHQRIAEEALERGAGDREC